MGADDEGKNKNWFNWFREKIKNYGYLMTLAGSVFYLLEACGLKINEPVAYGIVNAVAGLLIVLGLVNNPDGRKSNNFADAINFARGGKFCD